MALAHQLWFPWIGPGKDTAFHKTKHFLVFIGIAVDLHFHVWAMFEKKADAILLAYWCAFPVKTKYYLLLKYINNAFKPLEGYIDKEHILD